MKTIICPRERAQLENRWFTETLYSKVKRLLSQLTRKVIGKDRSTMRIAFDLDGVVLHQEMYSLKAIDSCKNDQERAELMRCYYSHRSIQLNPVDFLADDDDLFFITGRSVLVEEVTKKWAKKYFPMATVIATRTILPSSDSDLMTKNYVVDRNKEWSLIQAERKAKALNDNNIDVFFEDAPDVVKHLRRLCKSTKVVQYGGRF